MAVNMKLGIDVGAFKKGISDANAQLKTFDAQLKFAETSMKSAGNAEQGLVTKTNALEGKLKTQKAMIQQYTRALDEMKSHGVDPLSKEYQQLQAAMLNTKTAMMETEQALNGLDSSQQQAATSATQLVNSVNSIGKKISLEHVIAGINTITSGMETAAKKAVELGKHLWESISDSAAWADNTATQALIMDMSVEDYQRYKQVFDTVGDITIQEWHKMKRKVENAIQEPTEDQNQLFSLLGISTHEMHAGKYGAVAGMAKNYEDLFWEVSGELQRRVESGQMTQASANVFAEALFGKGFDELKPLIALGEEGFKQALEKQNVVTEDSVQKLADLNDQVIKLQSDFKALQAEVLAELAPALTKGAEVLDSLLGKLLEYLKSEDGQKALEDMGKAVEGLFTDLSKIDPETVVEGFAKVFNGIVGGLEWLTNNSGTVISALKAIVLGWGTLELTGGALQILDLINGIKGLKGGSPAAAPEAGPTGTGTGAVAASGPSWLNTFLNNAVNGMGVKAMFDLHEFATNLFKPEMADMNLREKQEYALMHDFGITPDELYKGVKGDAGGREFVVPIADNDHFVVEDVDIEAILNAKEGKEQIEEQVGTVDIPVRLTFGGGGGGGGAFNYTFDNGFSLLNRLGFHANGIWSVPSDNYLALLHRGERVVPAREVSSRNFSSNLYVENMNMNNGQDAEGLAAAIASANRRTMSGFGS